MSSMRNAVQRRNHKERAQPLERQKWGVLEKHKDYSLRAKDYNAKKARLKILQQKAAERNPDEFHFSMLSSRTDDHGRKIQERGNKSLSTSVVKLLKTQDAAYLRTVGVIARRKRERVEKEVLVGEGVKGMEMGRTCGEKVVFVGSREEQMSYGKEEGRGGDTSGEEENDWENMEVESDAASTVNVKSTKAQETEVAKLKAKRLLKKQRQLYQEVRKSKLGALKTRERELYKAEQELDMQRARMSNSVGGVTKAGVKWKVRERKR